MIFVLQSTCMEVSISLLCLYVNHHTKITYSDVLHTCGSSCMDHHTLFHVREGLVDF